MKNWDNVRVLLDRYYEGDTSVAEEQELRRLLNGTEVPADLQAEAQLLHWPAREQKIEAPLSDETLLQKLPMQEGKRTAVRSLWIGAYWQAAAAIALLVIGFGVGKLSNPAPLQPQAPPQTNSELTAMRQELAELKDMLRQSSTTGQRLQAVSVAAETPKADAELLMALIHTLHFDDNVNVRLAAVDALMQYRDHVQVRQALIHSLSIQTDPNVQLALIHGLTQLQEKEALPEMQKLLQEQELQKVVRQQLNQSIAILHRGA